MSEQSEMPPVDRSKRCMTSGRTEAEAEAASYREIDPATGMQKDYVVLCPAERAKGFVRPVRRSYRHVGSRPTYALRDLTDHEKEQYAKYNYVKFEEYPADKSPLTGKFWTRDELSSGCGGITTMGLALAETYARDPSFYGGTFCAHCRTHFALDQFVWEGTDEKLGS